MKVYTEQIKITKDKFDFHSLDKLIPFSDQAIPIRFIIADNCSDYFVCEVDYISGYNHLFKTRNIFDFSKRKYEDTSEFNAILLIPTGIGAEIGGHSGDANVIARLLAKVCDNLITHPNVVNAADINEMTENTLYVEGSIITRLLMGQIGLQKVRSNKVLMLMDKHPEKVFNNAIVNLISAARVTLGIECDVLQMNDLVTSTPSYTQSGRASGKIDNLERILEIISLHRNNYDAIALATFVDVSVEGKKHYYAKSDAINPWGGIEAMLTHSIALGFDMPCAHAPLERSLEDSNVDLGIVDPRKASESFSYLSLFSCIKGLHKTPKISYSKGLTVENISCLVIPDGCLSLPILAAIEQGIPVIAVRENKNIMKNNLSFLPVNHSRLFIVDNYLEAVGVMTALKAGIAPETTRRPISPTRVF